jgi:hypothetical protein
MEQRYEVTMAWHFFARAFGCKFPINKRHGPKAMRSTATGQALRLG